MSSNPPVLCEGDLRPEAGEKSGHAGDQFENLLRDAPLGVYLVDAEFRLSKLNPIARLAFGDIPNLIGRDFEEIMHILWPEAYANDVIQRFRHTLASGEPYIAPELVEQRMDRGVTECYEWRLSRIVLPDGTFGVVCYFWDISVRVKAQQTVRESEERYRSLFNSIDEGFCVIEMIYDEQGRPLDYRFLEINPSFVRHTGLNDMCGKRILEVFPDFEAYWIETLGKVALTGKPIRFVNEAKNLNRWFDVYAFPLAGGEKQKVAIIFNNVTEQRQSDAALRLSREEIRNHAAILETQVAERTAALVETIGELEAFSYSVSHDMRAPLRAMQNFSSILLEDHSGTLSGEAIGYLEKIKAAANRQDALIQDVLIYTQVLRADMPLQTVDLQKLFRDIVETYPQIYSSDATISIEGVLPVVLGHPAALTQCISNLLGNAIKFVPPGVKPNIRVWAQSVHFEERLWIEDNGIGIAPKDRERIFKMFERVHQAKAYEGTGVGLAIVRKAVERMRGTVGVESEMGKGSKFWMQFKTIP